MKNFKALSKAEMRKVTGGNFQCMTDSDCATGACINNMCANNCENIHGGCDESANCRRDSGAAGKCSTGSKGCACY